MVDRDAFLAGVRAPSATEGKQAFVLRHCARRRVLDVGCVDHDADNAFGGTVPWLHREISRVASRTLGLDMLEADVARLVAAGFDVVVGDAERFDLGETFDVVVAADIIEHLANLGSFLASVRTHLDTDGTFVLTTPNATALARTAQAVVRNRVQVNAEHTIWLDPSVAFEVLTRHGLEPVDFAWLHDEARSGSVASKILDRATAPLLRYRPLLRRSFGIAARRR